VPELAQAVRLLQQVPLLHGLGAGDLAAVARAAQACQVEGGQFFFRQGTRADVVYILQRGRVKLTQSTPEGLQVLLRFIGPGELFGPTAAFEGQVYPVSAEAVRWCRALCWKGRALAGLMEAYPRLALNALREVVTRLQDLRERYRELATERVERRVAHALIRLARQAGWQTEDGLLIDMPLSRQDLAELTGTTLYTVSRILSGWERGGLIGTGRQRVMILQPDGLRAVAEDMPAPRGAPPTRR
jgi:CRP/FNR family transcriptional regulator, nitrogen oxide reductase regulator